MEVDGKRMTLWLVAYMTGEFSKMVGVYFGKVGDFAAYMLLALCFFWLFNRWFSERPSADMKGVNHQQKAGDQ